MRVAAYCDARYLRATQQAAGPGAVVFASPPVTDAHAPAFVGTLQYADMVYFNFHAAPGQSAWLNVDGGLALSADTLRDFDLSRGVVFMVNCYAGGGMLAALRATHPRAIIGGDGENLGALDRLAGADLLGLWVRRALTLGLPPRAALGVAKQRLRLGPQTASVRDALEFKIL